MELAFGVLVFCELRNAGEAEEKSGTRTNNKLNPHMPPGRFERTFKRTMNTCLSHEESSLATVLGIIDL